MRLQELLFKKLFGREETDLVDESETAEGTAGGEASGEAGEGAPAAAAAVALEIQEGETAAAFARRVFRAVFEEDVQRLLSMVHAFNAARHPLIHPHTSSHTSRTLTHPHSASPPHPSPSQDSLWKERAKPVVLRLQDMTLPDAASLAEVKEVERRAWSLAENAAVLLAAIDHLVYTRGMRAACVSHAHEHGGMHVCV